MSKIIIVGSGGQGIRFLGNIFSKLLILKGYEVSAMYDYDAAMRGSDITAFIVFDKIKIGNPLISKADFLLVLDKTKLKFSAIEIADFSSKEFSEKRLANMYGLGFLIKKIGLNISDSEIVSVLPEKMKNTNFEAVKKGMKIE